MRSFAVTAALAAALSLVAATAQAAPAADFTRAVTRAPLSLEQAIAIALARNPEYLAAQAGVRGAQAGVRAARAPFAPTLQVRDDLLYANPVAQLQTPFGPLPFASTTTTNVPLLVARYALYDGGASAARFSRAAAELARAEGAQRHARQALIERTSTAYFDVVAATKLAQVAAAAVDLAGKHLRSAQQFFAAGQVPRADILRVQTELAGDRVDAVGADAAVASAQAALDDVLHVPLASTFVPTESLEASPAAPLELDALIATAKGNRGDLAAARAAVDAAERAVAEARAAGAPSLAAFVSDGNVQPAVASGYRNQFSAGLDLVWTLFDNGATSSGIAAASAGVDRARLDLERLESGVELEVREAYLSVSKAGAEVDAARELVRYADENLRLAQVRYRGGVGTALELQDAEQRDGGAHQRLVEAQVGLREGLVRLRFSAGLL